MSKKGSESAGSPSPRWKLLPEGSEGNSIPTPWGPTSATEAGAASAGAAVPMTSTERNEALKKLGIVIGDANRVR
ncbi:hypothetical protein GCM10012319_33890 [Comamonas sp. KCTC 72670]|nr:hypothetical protein GCM10012319_33890 [Comamonas sp. KCTC 72670]